MAPRFLRYKEGDPIPPLDMEAARESLKKSGMESSIPLLGKQEDEETRFLDWYKGWAQKTGLAQDPDDPQHQYDYRAAFRAGAEPIISAEDGKYHWPSQFKLAGHKNRFVGGEDTKTGKKISFLKPLPPEPTGDVFTAFGKGFQHEATLGYTGEFEPQTRGEQIANVAGKVAGFAVPAIALTPAGRAAATALKLGKSAAAAETIAGAIYGATRKPEEEESRIGNVVKDAALFGLGGLAFDAVRKILRETTPFGDKVLKVAQEFKIAPEQAEIIVRETAKGKNLVKAYEEVVGPARYSAGEGAGFFEATPPKTPGEAEQLKRAFKESRKLPETPRELEYADYEFPSQGTIGGLPAAREIKIPYARTTAKLADEIGQAATRVPSEQIRQGIFRPTIEIRGAKPFLETPDFPSSKRPEFSASTPKMHTLYKSGLITPEAELTPEGARFAGLFNFLRPRAMDEKVQAALAKIPSSLDENFANLPTAVKRFFRNEVEGPMGAVSDSFARGATFAEALDKGIQTFARTRKFDVPAGLEASPQMLRQVFDEVMGRAKLASARAQEILPKLDPEMPASDLAKKAQIPVQDAEAILDEIAANIRDPFKIGMGGKAFDPESLPGPKMRSIPPLKNALGDEILSPEILDRALVATEITPEQFKNGGFLRPDGTLTEQGRDLLNVLNPEWRIPYTEKVIDRPPKPARVGSYGRKLEAFDVNSPEGRVGLASVRSGGKSNVPLSKGTIEGFLPMSVEDAMGRKSPLVRKVPGGFQFTEKGAALAATRPGGIVHEIDVAANRQYVRLVGEKGEVSFAGGRGGKTFRGMSEEQVKAANLEYEVEKQIVKEYREAALQWKGCPEDES